MRIRDLGWKKVGSEIRDKHPGSATLIDSMENMVSRNVCIGLFNGTVRPPALT
jgi:hypothetical protein